MNWFQNMVIKLLKIKPARDREIVIKEPLSFQANVLKNKILYRGDSAEIEQFFKSTAFFDVEKSRFWASVPFGKVRKIHSGIVSTVIDRYRDIVTADLDNILFNEDSSFTPIKDLWVEMCKENNFFTILGNAIQEVLTSGDGAFKIVTDKISQYPIIQFHDAENVEFVTKYDYLIEIKFYTTYFKNEKTFRLQETYGRGYIKYKLFSEDGKECMLTELEETKELNDTSFDGDFIMGVPFKVFNSSKWQGRGKALFDSKTESIDALDEIISQWLDAVRMGRINRYIPEDLVPRNPHTGELIESNPFDNNFIAIGSSLSEDKISQIDISQPQIFYDAYVNSYASFLDIVLQGIMSPSTLGIDLKKTDNATSQREKEKITLHVRNKIVDALTEVIPEVVNITLKAYDLIQGVKPQEYNISVKFGEYASPDFDTTVEIVAKAKTASIMSIEKAIDELYGDTMTQEEKEEEVKRLKDEQGLLSVDEPSAAGQDGDKIKNDKELESADKQVGE